MEYISKLIELSKTQKETSLIVIIFNVKGRTIVKDNYDKGDSLDAEYYSTSQCDNIVMTLRKNDYNVKCYFNELDFIHDHILGLLKNTYPLELVVINFGQIGRSVGRKSLIPAYCDINDIVHTNSNALSVSLAREKYFWSKILNGFTAHSCKAWFYSGKYGWIDGEPEIGIKVLAKLSNESCSIGLNDASIVTYDGTNTHVFKEISEKYNNANLIVQEFISGLEVEVPFVNSSSVYVFEPLGISVEGNAELGDQILDFYTRNSGGKFSYYNFAERHAELSNSIKKEVAEVAKFLCLEGIGRIDFRIAQDLSRFCITDINCNPHITKTMSVYKAMQKLGFNEYIATLELLIGSALDRMSESKKAVLAKYM